MPRKRNLRDKIILAFSNNPIIVLIWAIVLFFSSLVTIVDGSKLLIKYVNLTVFQTFQHQKMLEKISINLDIKKYFEILGEPISRGEAESFNYFLFSNSDFYLTALTDDSDKVLAYSVVSKKEEFQPKFKLPGSYKDNGYVDSIVLNKTAFSDVHKTIESDSFSGSSPTCYLYIGARKTHYFEGSYLGNPSNYQTVYYGVNEAGFRKISNVLFPEDIWLSYIHGDSQCLKVDKEFRNNIVNTFAVTSPHYFSNDEISTESASILFGPDIDEVRVLPGFTRYYR